MSGDTLHISQLLESVCRCSLDKRELWGSTVFPEPDHPLNISLHIFVRVLIIGHHVWKVTAKLCTAVSCIHCWCWRCIASQYFRSTLLSRNKLIGPWAGVTAESYHSVTSWPQFLSNPKKTARTKSLKTRQKHTKRFKQNTTKSSKKKH